MSFDTTLLFGFLNPSNNTTAYRKRAVATSSASDGATFSNTTISTNTTVTSNTTTLGFAAESSSDYTTTGWVFYGNTLLWVSDDNGLESSFYVSNTTANSNAGVLSMGWLPDGETKGSDDLQVTVRKVKPSNAQK